MSRSLVLLLLALAVATPAAAQSASPAAAPATLQVGVLKPFGSSAPQITESQKQERLERAALNAELEAVFTRTRTALAGLRDQLSKTSEPAQRDALHARAIRLKQDEMVEFYRVQLRFAESAGRTAQAEQLRGIVQALTAPAVARVAPANRATRGDGEIVNGAAR